MTASERQTEKQKLILKKRIEITSLKKISEVYHFSVAYYVSTEAHFYTSILQPVLPRPLAVWGRWEKTVCKITGRKKPTTKQNTHMHIAMHLLEGGTKQNQEP